MAFDVVSRIAYFMEVAGIKSINELANRALLTQSTVDNIMRRKNQSPKVETLEKICDGLGITLYEFFAPDIVELVLEKADRMNLDTEGRKIINEYKKMLPQEQQKHLLLTLNKLIYLPDYDREAIVRIIESLSSSRPSGAV